MRFRIDIPGRGNAVSTLRFQQTEIAIRYPHVQRQRTHNEKLLWAWPDGPEYALIVPYGGHTPFAQIASAESVVCTGLGVSPAQRQKPLPGKTVPMVEWNLPDRVVLTEGGRLCCKTFPRTWTLRQQDGKRLAFWLARWGGYEGAWSPGIPEDTVPIIAGIIVAQIHDWY